MRFSVHGQIAHAELAIGNSTVMLGEEAPEYGFPGPAALGGSPVSIHLFVDDADAVELPARVFHAATFDGQDCHPSGTDLSYGRRMFARMVMRAPR